MYSGIRKRTEAFVLTELGLHVINHCNNNPPDFGDGPINVMLFHEHEGYERDDLYKKVKVKYSDYIRLLTVLSLK